MLKRNLLKRALPFMLSLAMAFQSVPMTALAVEGSEAVVSTTEADPAAEPEAAETPSPDGSDNLDLTGDTSASSDSDQIADETEGTDDGSKETETAGAGTGAGDSETDDSNKEATDAESEAAVNNSGTDGNAAQPGQDAQATVVSTEITVPESLSLPDFARDNAESRLTYVTPYSENDQFGGIMDAVKNAADFKINDEPTPELKSNYLILEWKEVKKAEDGTETLAAMTGTPKNVGSYALHLETRAQEGICGAAEYNVYFNITPRKLGISLENADTVLSVEAGSKIADFKTDIEKAVKLKDDGNEFKDLQFSIAVKVFKDGDTAEATDIFFNRNSDYKVKVEATLDAAAMGNYEVTGGEYLVRFVGLLPTKVNVKVANPGSEIVKTYEKGKSYKAADIATEYGISAVVTDDKDMPLGADVADADKQAVPKWYVKEINKDSNNNNIITEFPEAADVDGIKQFFWPENGNDLYTRMTEESVGEVGEYYLVYGYEGVNGQYDKSHSDPIKVTIDPVEVILVPTKVGELNTGMTPDAINKALAEVESELRVPDTADATLASANKSDAPAADKDFYGVSYDNGNTTQYYSPVFGLMRKTRTRLPEAQWPANATEDQKWSDWTAPVPVTELRVDDERVQYKYYIRFTGEKAVYRANGTQISKRPVAEAADSANRNYKVKADSYTLDNEKNMLEVTLVEAAETTIDVSAIIKEFNDSGRGKGGSGLTADDPAWTIFDPDAAIFADKASYKKAVVTSTIKDTHEDITYTWQSGSWDQYYELSRMEKGADETDEAFTKRKESAVAQLEASFTDCITNPYVAPYNAGFYRLHVEYEDSSLVPKNAPAVGDAYFLIRKQELMLAADTQYAKYGDEVSYFTRQGFRMYAIPGNEENALDLSSDLPLNWQAWHTDWAAMNLKKNPDGSNSAEWEVSTGTFIQNAASPYVYKAAVWLNDDWIQAGDTISDTDGNTVTNKAGYPVYWSNYTTQNMAAWDADAGDYKQHYIVGGVFGDIKFDADEIAIVVDRSKLFDDKIYDGKPIADALPEGFIKLTDKATGAEIPETVLKVNGEPQDGVGNVWVEWKWKTDDHEWDSYVLTEEAKYGGTYTLAAYFEGNDTYSPFRTDDRTDDPNPWSGWVDLEDQDGPIEFEIKPLDVEITPILKEEVRAGDPVSEMVEDWHVEAKTADPNRRIPDGTDGSDDDRWLFDRGDGIKWDAINDEEVEFTESYPILQDNTVEDPARQNEVSFTPVYYEDNKSIDGSDVIRYGRRYDVRLSNSYSLFAQYAASYNLTFKPAALANIVRGEAEVWETGFFDDTITGETEGQVSIYTEKDKDDTYKIVPREGIPFAYEGYNLKAWDSFNSRWKTITKDLITDEEIPLNKNYIAINIVAPREFSREFNPNYDFAKNNFIFGNSIKSANGYVIAANGRVDEDGTRRYIITALFPVELNESGKIADPEKKFSVTWEEGYTDNFNLNLTNAKVEANLKKAVAPKALAFNGVQAKMAVGEEQQLDVKITKAQLGDVVRIRYRLSDGKTSNEYASINPETGLITALAANNGKPAAVNVEAYPVRLAKDGKTYEEITGKGVKAAKTKVTVTEVTAPAIKKIIPKDVSAEVQYTKVDNGYRREIYVVKLENKKDAGKWKAADFEEAIENTKNGQWQDTFAIAPKYYSGTRGYNPKLKLYQILLDFNELESSAYVVYVRNVSAARTLADGSKVTLSSAGTVKMFETTKSQVKGLKPYFEVTAEKTRQNPVRYYNDKDESAGYIVELADKSAQVLVKGWFLDKPSDAAADSEDYSWLQLSLKAAEKALGVKLTDKYQDPKLTYYVTDGESPDFDEKSKLKNPSKYVTVNNKGKLTFKGVDRNGEVHVRVYIRADNGVSDYCNLTITARPDTLTTRKVKTMKVGDAIRLADYLEYKQGKAKVPYHWSSNIEITNWDEVEKAGFRIYQAGADGETHPSIDGELRRGEYIIIAAKEDSRCNLEFKDWLWKSASNDKVQTEEKSISLSTSKLDPVKSLKTVYVDDKHITVNFAHAGHPEAFDIEVRDARDNVVYKKLAYREWAMRSGNMISAGADSWLQNMQSSLLADYGNQEYFRYFEKTRMYAFTINTDRLMRLSSYTISVTPVYDGQSAVKAVTTGTKTTNIPASYANCDIFSPDHVGGIDIGIGISNLNTYLTSGNTYTLVADSHPEAGFDPVDVNTGIGDHYWHMNQIAKDRGTDTLTWKSSNSKVASIKANQGSYSATLKALQQGKTTITVTSKVTKKTIARYHIAVKAVGKGSGYGGEYENSNGHNGFYDSFIKTVDPLYEGRLEVLTVSNPVHVTDEDMLNNPSNDRTWVQFTAPSYGEYTFNCNTDYQIYYSNGTERDFGNQNDGQTTLRLEEGQKIYFRVRDTFTLSVSKYVDFTKLTSSFTKDKPLKVTKDMWVSFVAPEDNYYTFNGNITKYEMQSLTEDVYNNQFELGMKAGETVFIYVRARGELYVTKRDLSKALGVGDTGASMSFTKDNAQETQYVSFRADVTGDYSFTYSPSDEIMVKFLPVSGDAEYADGNAVVAPKVKAMADTTDPGTSAAPASETVNLFMDGGETIVIAVTVTDPAAITGDKKIDVTVKAATTAVKGLALGSEQTVPKSTSQIFEYTIPDDKTATVYTVAATENASVTWYYSKTQKETGNYWESDTQLGEITEITYNNNSFTVEEGKVVEPYLTGKRSLNAGDRIYIKVTAGDAADSKVTLTSIVDNRTFDAATPASAELGAKDGDAVWYTFTVKKAGYYEFGMKVTAAPAEAAAQSVEAYHVDGAFSNTESDPYIHLYDGDLTSGVKKLSVGSYVFKVAATSDAAESVKTTAVLSVKEIVPTVISEGDTPVALAKDEVKYYSFKAATNNTYTIKWTADAESGTADAQYLMGSLDDPLYTGNLSDIDPFGGENTCYIKLTQTGDKAVSGKLQVIAREKKFLTSGKEESFEIKEDGGSIGYTFTIPEDSKLGYMVIVENTSTADETKGQTMPAITVKDTTFSWNTIVDNLGKGKASAELSSWRTKYETKRITITANNVTAPTAAEAGISATGKITIKPVTAQALSETADKIVKTDSKWYTYTIPADNRYVFDYAVGTDQDKNGVEVTWYGKETDGKRELSYAETYPYEYLEKGQELYVNVKAADAIADAGVDVTLKAPAALQMTELTLTDGKAEVDVTIPEGRSDVYYTFTAPAYANYTVSASGIDMYRFLPDEDGSNVRYYSSGSLEKDEKVLIRATTAGKLIITQDLINELKLNEASKEIMLKPGESAAFMLPLYADGYYDFKMSDAKGLYISAESTVYEDTENRCYFAADISREEFGNRYEFTITNPGETEAKLTVTAGKLEPVDLKLGTTDIPVAKDRISITKFMVPERYWYTVTCSAGSELVNGYGYAIGEEFWHENSTLINYLEYSGTEAIGTAQVTIAKLAPAPAGGDKIALSLEADESKWYAYRTTAAGEYTFTAPTGVMLACYKSLSSDSSMISSSVTVRAGAEAEIYVKATNSSNTKIEGEEANITVTSEPAEELTVGENPVTESGDSYFTFKAPEDGFYSFDVTNGSCYFYGENVWSGSLLDNSPYLIRKDTVVYLSVSSGSSGNTITVAKVKDAEVLAHVDVTSGEYQWIIFTAPADGTYTFASTNNSDDPKAWFFKDQNVGDNADVGTLNSVSESSGYGYDDDNGNGKNNFSKEIELSAGETVYIAVGYYSLNSPVSCDVYVTY